MLAVRPGRIWVYWIGVAIGLGTLFVAIFPTDEGGVCGSVLNPYQAEESLDWGPDPFRYFERCDDRAAIHGMLVLGGSATSGLLVGNALVLLGSRRRDKATRTPATVGTRASGDE